LFQAVVQAQAVVLAAVDPVAAAPVVKHSEAIRIELHNFNQGE